MTTPTKQDKQDLEGLPLLFNLIEKAGKVSKIKSLLKSDKSLATARLNGVEDGHNALSLACQANNIEIVKLLVTSYDVDVSLCHCWSDRFLVLVLWSKNGSWMQRDGVRCTNAFCLRRASGF